MGASLVLEYLVQPEGSKLDWTAGRRRIGAIKHLSEIEDAEQEWYDLWQEHSDDEGVLATPNSLLKAITMELAADLDELRKTIEKGHRHYNRITVPGYTVHIFGGTSSGDAPTIFYQARRLYLVPGLVEAIGFQQPLPDPVDDLSIKVG